MTDSAMLWGFQLSPDQQRAALARYCNRFTLSHRPSWASAPRPDGSRYPPQFASDSDWLLHTRFAVTRSGRLDGRASHCESFPTWPLNPELRPTPYSVTAVA